MQYCVLIFRFLSFDNNKYAVIWSNSRYNFGSCFSNYVMDKFSTKWRSRSYTRCSSETTPFSKANTSFLSYHILIIIILIKIKLSDFKTHVQHTMKSRLISFHKHFKQFLLKRFSSESNFVIWNQNVHKRWNTHVFLITTLCALDHEN